jgi:protein disulfide isomerase
MLKLAAFALLALGPVFVRSDELGYGADGAGAGGDDYEYGGAASGGAGYSGNNYEDGRDGPPPTPAFTLLEEVDSVEKFLKDEDTEPAVIGFFDPETNKKDMEAFESAATANKYELRFAYATSAAVRAAYKATSGAHVNVYKPPRFVGDKVEKPKARYPGKAVDELALVKFAKKAALPLVGQKTWKSNDRYEAAGVPIVTLFAEVDLEKNAKGFDYYANRMRKVAAEYAGKLVFNIGDKSDFSYLVEDYDLKLPEKKDFGVGIKDGAKHYGMVEAFSVDALRAFIDQFLAGSLTPKIKEVADYSEPHPEEEEDDGTPSDVVKVTAANFDEVVNAPGKDVMIEFYAPWCGHCKQLKPVYKKLAAQFKDVPSVTIAAMDATASDPPKDYKVEGYPTILFVPSGTKKAVSYDDGRDLASMAAYIKKHASTPITDEL